jgi:hypothetical protein
VLTTRDGAVRAQAGHAESPDAVIAGPPRPILGVLLGLIQLADAEAGGVTYEGDPGILDRFGADMAPTGSLAA